MLRNSLLAARDLRQALLESLCGSAPCLIMLSLNLPGPQKSGERARRLFDFGARQLEGALPVTLLHGAGDPLGPYALFKTELSPRQAKQGTLALESGSRAGRLLDLDVYDHAASPVARALFGLPPRRCLICPEPAVECMRLKRHDSKALLEEVYAIIDEL